MSAVLADTTRPRAADVRIAIWREPPSYVIFRVLWEFLQQTGSLPEDGVCRMTDAWSEWMNSWMGVSRDAEGNDRLAHITASINTFLAIVMAPTAPATKLETSRRFARVLGKWNALQADLKRCGAALLVDESGCPRILLHVVHSHCHPAVETFWMWRRGGDLVPFQPPMLGVWPAVCLALARSEGCETRICSSLLDMDVTRRCAPLPLSLLTPCCDAIDEDEDGGTADEELNSEIHDDLTLRSAARAASLACLCKLDMPATEARLLRDVTPCGPGEPLDSALLRVMAGLPAWHGCAAQEVSASTRGRVIIVAPPPPRTGSRHTSVPFLRLALRNGIGTMDLDALGRARLHGGSVPPALSEGSTVLLVKRSEGHLESDAKPSPLRRGLLRGAIETLNAGQLTHDLIKAGVMPRGTPAKTLRVEFAAALLAVLRSVNHRLHPELSGRAVADALRIAVSRVRHKLLAGRAADGTPTFEEEDAPGAWVEMNMERVGLGSMRLPVQWLARDAPHATDNRNNSRFSSFPQHDTEAWALSMCRAPLSWKLARCFVEIRPFTPSFLAPERALYAAGHPSVLLLTDSTMADEETLSHARRVCLILETTSGKTKTQLVVLERAPHTPNSWQANTRERGLLSEEEAVRMAQEALAVAVVPRETLIEGMNSAFVHQLRIPPCQPLGVLQDGDPQLGATSTQLPAYGAAVAAVAIMDTVINSANSGMERVGVPSAEADRNRRTQGKSPSAQSTTRMSKQDPRVEFLRTLVSEAVKQRNLMQEIVKSFEGAKAVTSTTNAADSLRALRETLTSEARKHWSKFLGVTGALARMDVDVTDISNLESNLTLFVKGKRGEDMNLDVVMADTTGMTEWASAKNLMQQLRGLVDSRAKDVLHAVENLAEHDGRAVARIRDLREKVERLNELQVKMTFAEANDVQVTLGGERPVQTLEALVVNAASALLATTVHVKKVIDEGQRLATTGIALLDASFPGIRLTDERWRPQNDALDRANKFLKEFLPDLESSDADGGSLNLSIESGNQSPSVEPGLSMQTFATAARKVLKDTALIVASVLGGSDEHGPEVAYFFRMLLERVAVVDSIEQAYRSLLEAHRQFATSSSTVLSRYIDGLTRAMDPFRDAETLRERLEPLRTEQQMYAYFHVWPLAPAPDAATLAERKMYRPYDGDRATQLKESAARDIPFVLTAVTTPQNRHPPGPLLQKWMDGLAAMVPARFATDSLARAIRDDLREIQRQLARLAQVISEIPNDVVSGAWIKKYNFGPLTSAVEADTTLSTSGVLGGMSLARRIRERVEELYTQLERDARTAKTLNELAVNAEKANRDSLDRAAGGVKNDAAQMRAQAEIIRRLGEEMGGSPPPAHLPLKLVADGLLGLASGVQSHLGLMSTAADAALASMAARFKHEDALADGHLKEDSFARDNALRHLDTLDAALAAARQALHFDEELNERLSMLKGAAQAAQVAYTDAESLTKPDFVSNPQIADARKAMEDAIIKASQEPRHDGETIRDVLEKMKAYLGSDVTREGLAAAAAKAELTLAAARSQLKTFDGHVLRNLTAAFLSTYEAGVDAKLGAATVATNRYVALARETQQQIDKWLVSKAGTSASGTSSDLNSLVSTVTTRYVPDAARMQMQLDGLRAQLDSAKHGARMVQNQQLLAAEQAVATHRAVVEELDAVMRQTRQRAASLELEALAETWTAQLDALGKRLESEMPRPDALKDVESAKIVTTALGRLTGQKEGMSRALKKINDFEEAKEPSVQGMTREGLAEHVGTMESIVLKPARASLELWNNGGDEMVAVERALTAARGAISARTGELEKRLRDAHGAALRVIREVRAAAAAATNKAGLGGSAGGTGYSAKALERVQRVLTDANRLEEELDATLQRGVDACNMARDAAAEEAENEARKARMTLTSANEDTIRLRQLSDALEDNVQAALRALEAATELEARLKLARDAETGWTEGARNRTRDDISRLTLDLPQRVEEAGVAARRCEEDLNSARHELDQRRAALLQDQTGASTDELMTRREDAARWLNATGRQEVENVASSVPRLEAALKMHRDSADEVADRVTRAIETSRRLLEAVLPELRRARGAASAVLATRPPPIMASRSRSIAVAAFTVLEMMLTKSREAGGVEDTMSELEKWRAETENARNAMRSHEAVVTAVLVRLSTTSKVARADLRELERQLAATLVYLERSRLVTPQQAAKRAIFARPPPSSFGATRPDLGPPSEVETVIRRHSLLRSQPQNVPPGAAWGSWLLTTRMPLDTPGLFYGSDFLTERDLAAAVALASAAYNEAAAPNEPTRLALAYLWQAAAEDSANDAWRSQGAVRQRGTDAVEFTLLTHGNGDRMPIVAAFRRALELADSGRLGPRGEGGGPTHGAQALEDRMAQLTETPTAEPRLSLATAPPRRARPNPDAFFVPCWSVAGRDSGNGRLLRARADAAHGLHTEPVRAGIQVDRARDDSDDTDRFFLVYRGETTLGRMAILGRFCGEFMTEEALEHASPQTLDRDDLITFSFGEDSDASHKTHGGVFARFVSNELRFLTWTENPARANCKVYVFDSHELGNPVLLLTATTSIYHNDKLMGLRGPKTSQQQLKPAPQT